MKGLVLYPTLAVRAGHRRCGTQLSIVTSASSHKRLPEECVAGDASDCSRLVMAMTLTPRAFISNAISTGTALRPEFEMMIAASPRSDILTRNQFAGEPDLTLSARAFQCAF